MHATETEIKWGVFWFFFTVYTTILNIFFSKSKRVWVRTYIEIHAAWILVWFCGLPAELWAACVWRTTSFSSCLFHLQCPLWGRYSQLWKQSHRTVSKVLICHHSLQEELRLCCHLREVAWLPSTNWLFVRKVQKYSLLLFIAHSDVTCLAEDKSWKSATPQSSKKNRIFVQSGQPEQLAEHMKQPYSFKVLDYRGQYCP